MVDNENNVVVDFPMFILSSKFKPLKSILKKWNKDIFDDTNFEVSQATDE